jgi:hypothetical protein
MEAGATHRQQHTRDKQSVPIQFNRADATAWLVLAGISDLAPPIISFLLLGLLFGLLSGLF